MGGRVRGWEGERDLAFSFTHVRETLSLRSPARHLRGGDGHGILRSLKNQLFGVRTEEPALDKDIIKDVREQLVTSQDALLQAHNTIEGSDASTKDVFGYTEQVNMTTFQIQILGTVKTLQDMIKTIDGLLAE